MADLFYEDREALLAAEEAAHIGGYPGDYPDDPDSFSDKAHRAVIEAGGGESEGFEESERLLIEHTSHGDQMPAHSILHHQGLDEEDNTSYADGEADHAYTSEREDDEEDDIYDYEDELEDDEVEELYA